MKKLFVMLAIAAGTVFSANAQSTGYVSGTLGFWRDNDAKTTQFSIVPEIGFNLNSRWALGVQIGYVHEQQKVHDLKIKDNGFIIAPYARYTLFSQGLFSMFLDGGVGYSTTKADGAERQNGWEIGIKPGIMFNLSDNFSLVAKYGFLGYRDTYGLGRSFNGFGLGFTSEDLSLGFQCRF